MEDDVSSSTKSQGGKQKKKDFMKKSEETRRREEEEAERLKRIEDLHKRQNQLAVPPASTDPLVAQYLSEIDQLRSTYLFDVLPITQKKELEIDYHFQVALKKI